MIFFGFWLEFYELLIENVRRYKSHGPKKRNMYLRNSNRNQFRVKSWSKVRDLMLTFDNGF